MRFFGSYSLKKKVSYWTIYGSSEGLEPFKVLDLGTIFRTFLKFEPKSFELKMVLDKKCGTLKGSSFLARTLKKGSENGTQI